jgi:hypothetical protein
MQPFSLSNCLRDAWTTFKQNIADYVLAQFVLLAAYLVASGALSATGRGGFVLGALLGSVLWTCSMSIAHAGARNGKPTIQDAFRPLAERQGDYLMVALAMSAGVIGCLIGIVVSWFLCAFAPLLALEGRDFKQAVIESKDLVLKYPADVALLAIVVSAINLAGTLACGIGIIFSMPIACLTVLKAHEQLAAKLALEPQTQVPPAQY